MISMERSSPYFTSLGMFIIDEIEFPSFKLAGILGGGGTFAIFGSRMVLGSEQSDKCAWIVDVGKDCPQEILTELKSWQTGAIFRYDDSRYCTRGLNIYGENDFRDFWYLTPKKRITMEDLHQYPWMLKSRSFHFVCSPKRCTELLKELDMYSSKVNLGISHGVIAWEPIPDCCTPEFLDDTLRILSKIDILTPNAAECAAFFGESEPLDKQNCERVGLKFSKFMTKTNSGIVLRCGGMGSLIISSQGERLEWFPAYHQKSIDDESNKVIDPTGCGNTFVGAFATAFVKSGGDFRYSSICATVASGACIEQHGLPKISYVNGKELWNGVSFEERMQIYEAKLETL